MNARSVTMMMRGNRPTTDAVSSIHGRASQTEKETHRAAKTQETPNFVATGT